MNYLQYIYTKERRTFGRQCLFTNRNELLFSEPPHPEYSKEYILKNPVHRGTQLSKQMALSECNTENVQYAHHGMNHIEGGWPKDVNMHDEEQTLRYRKKIERDEIWGQQLLSEFQRVLRSVLQNNAVNIYENYFEDSMPLDPPGEYAAHIVGIYRDQLIPPRPVTHMSWCPNGSERFVCSYTCLDFQPVERSIDSYIWDLEDANKPEMSLTAPAAIISAEWNPRDEHMIAAGLRIGTVAIWDPRSGSKETMSSVRETSHRERVTSLRWLHSKTNTEFFSASSDATVLFWDARILKGPMGTVVIDPERTENPERLRAHAISVLEFEFTISTRYMVGSELGYIFIGNRKAMTPSEALLARWPVMTGPIYDLIRNPIYVKYFLVVGDYAAKICVEDCKEGELICTKNHPSELRCGTWSSTRCSLFFLGRCDGVLEFWDLIMSQEKPILEKKICTGPIWSLKSSESGKLLAVGTDPGDIYVFELDDALTVSDRNEKAAVGAIFERETRRVKLLEGRMREINLKIAAEEAKRKKLEEEARKRELEEMGEGDGAPDEEDQITQGTAADQPPPAEPVGESVSMQGAPPPTEEEGERASKQDEEAKSGAGAADEEEGSASEGDEVKTLVEIQNTETLFFNLIDDERNTRSNKSYNVVKTPFDVAYEREQMKVEGESQAAQKSGILEELSAQVGQGTMEKLGTQVPRESQDTRVSHATQRSLAPQESQAVKESTPRGSQAPQELQVPSGSRTPAGSQAPRVSIAPQASLATRDSQAPRDSQVPQGSQTPQNTSARPSSRSAQTPRESQAAASTQSPRNSQGARSQGGPSQGAPPSRGSENANVN
ncbi:dynein intermediate chain 2, axonemal-like [Hermetia illucens]|uniref:dynein intermediate chain 2, axonemal-like n=1 Tax=Hermetia illucens TaxID=343691 RepID=UPI0018CC346E|nr:dynein intermediate chain 2, axonemal-like [Hermetia illucens]